MNFGYFGVFWRIFFGYTGISLPPLADPEKCANNDCCTLSQGSETCVVGGRKLNWRATLPGSKRQRKTKEIEKHQIRYFATVFFKAITNRNLSFLKRVQYLLYKGQQTARADSPLSIWTGVGRALISQKNMSFSSGQTKLSVICGCPNQLCPLSGVTL